MKFTKWLALSLAVIFCTSACTPPKPAAPSESQIESVEKMFLEYVDFETTKLFKGKFKLGSQLVEKKSAMVPVEYLFSDANGHPNYTNLVWFPTTRPKTKECTLDLDWTIDCIVTYSETEKATCHITEILIDKKGKPREFPNLKSFYRSDGTPRFKFDCYLEKDFSERKSPKHIKSFFMVKPEIVEADLLSITKALLQNHSCNFPDFQVSRIIPVPGSAYMVVTDTLAEPGEASEPSFYWVKLTLEPQYDNYALSSGIGWDSFFGCDQGLEINYVSSTGDSINRILPYID